jgi:hypothetical protein
MAISITYEQLTKAVFTGAYNRFATIRKTVDASYRNRKVPVAVQEEIGHFVILRDEIVARLGGTINASKTDYDWPSEEKDEAQLAIADLMSRTVELPGEKIGVVSLLDGGLCETDYDLLAPFLAS